MPFHVICLETGEAYSPTIGGSPEIFANGGEAATIARQQSEYTGKKYQPRAIVSDDWRQREQARLDSGAYQRLPWHDAPWFKGSVGELEHYAHVSTERDGMVAFTEDATKGAADRQTRMRPGAYLQRFYSDKLSADEIQSLAREFAGRFEDNTLLFATTADEIEHVYTHGPNSCMSHGLRDYNSSIHPTRVYAAGDLAIAYTKRADNIVARVLCWPERKTYGRVYGDADRLVPLLDAAGFKSGSLRGAKLLRIEEDDCLVCPYIDTYYSIDDCGDYLRIGGDIPADSTNGLINLEDGEYCPSCEERCDPDSFVYIEDVEESWCESCAENTFQCARTGERYARERNVVRMANGDYWARSEFEDHGFTCDGSGDCYPADEMVMMENGETWSLEHFDSHGFECRQCNDCFPNEDGVETLNGMYCEDCAPEPQSDDDTPQPIERKHIARQGRDESPLQIEMDFAAFRPGDVVRLNMASDHARYIIRWRQANGYPAWDSETRLTISNVFEATGNLRFQQSAVTATPGETWNPEDAFIVIGRA